MKKEDFMQVVMHPETRQFGMRPVISNTKFRVFEGVTLDRMPNVVLSAAGDTAHELELRIQKRMEVLYAVFGEAVDNQNFRKFDWTIEDQYIYPSDAILMETEDPLQSTLLFLAYRNWQMAMAAETTSCLYLTEREFDSECGYKIGRAEVKSRSLSVCRSISDAAEACNSLLKGKSIRFVQFPEVRVVQT